MKAKDENIKQIVLRDKLPINVAGFLVTDQQVDFLTVHELGIEIRTKEMRVKYISADTSISVLAKYTSGIWVFADVPLSTVKDIVGYVINEPYKVLNISDVGK